MLSHIQADVISRLVDNSPGWICIFAKNHEWGVIPTNWIVFISFVHTEQLKKMSLKHSFGGVDSELYHIQTDFIFTGFAVSKLRTLTILLHDHTCYNIFEGFVQSCQLFNAVFKAA